MADTPFSGALPLAKPSFHTLVAAAEPDRPSVRPICTSR